MIDVERITALHRETVALWHEQPIRNPYQGFLHAVCEQHTRNFQLWHEEDIARSTDVTDARIAAVKRAIDGYNQQRNDWIEKLDDMILLELTERGVRPAADATLNTETPGSAIDRLSILSLRIYHLVEQYERPDVSEEHLQKVETRLAVCLQQLQDLSKSLARLCDDIFAGRNQFKLYRQMKMYNDPTLNPYLYQSRRRKAG